MTRTQISAMLRDISVAIDDGGSNDLDFAQSKVAELRRNFAPPNPTTAQQDAVLSAMRDGHHSAVAIRAETGLNNSVIYASRYLLHRRGLIFQYDNGAGPVRWGCDPL